MSSSRRKYLFLWCLIGLFALITFLAIRGTYINEEDSTWNSNIGVHDIQIETTSTKVITATKQEATPPSPPPPPPSPPLYHPSHLVQVPHVTTKAFSAYFDERTKFHGPAIYVLGIQSNNRWKQTLYGKLVYSNGLTECIGPSITELCCGYKCNRYIHYTTYNTLYHIFQFPSQVNLSNLPTTIHLSLTKSCSNPSEGIQIYSYRPKKKREFGVCIQSPLYGKVAKRLVQFIEINRILGAERITVYSMVNELEKNELLKPYQADGMLDIIPWPRDFKKSNLIHYYGEILSIHDCLYRNMHLIEHLVLVDLDELIIPRKVKSWKELIESVKKPNTQGYHFRNTYFLEGSDKKKSGNDCEKVDYFTKIYRTACEFDLHRRSKFIVVPYAVNSIDIHGIASSNKIEKVYIPYDVGSLFHFRKDVTKDCIDKTLVYDPVMLKYENEFIQRNPKTCKNYNNSNNNNYK